MLLGMNMVLRLIINRGFGKMFEYNSIYRAWRYILAIVVILIVTIIVSSISHAANEPESLKMWVLIVKVEDLGGNEYVKVYGSHPFFQTKSHCESYIPKARSLALKQWTIPGLFAIGCTPVLNLGETI